MRTHHDPAAARWTLAREAGAHVAHALPFGLGSRPVSQRDPRGRFQAHRDASPAPRGGQCLAHIAEDDIMGMPAVCVRQRRAENRRLAGGGSIHMLIAPSAWRGVAHALAHDLGVDVHTAVVAG